MRFIGGICVFSKSVKINSDDNRPVLFVLSIYTTVLYIHSAEAEIFEKVGPPILTPTCLPLFVSNWLPYYSDYSSSKILLSSLRSLFI